MRHVPVAIVLLVLAVVLAAMPAWVMNAEGSIQAVFLCHLRAMTPTPALLIGLSPPSRGRGTQSGKSTAI